MMLLAWVALAHAGPSASPEQKVYLADRIDLVTARITASGATEVARETLYDNGFGPPPDSEGLSAPVLGVPWTADCGAAALAAGTVRWLDFSAQRDEVSGVEEALGAWSSLSPDFDTTLAAVQDALAWRTAAVAGKLDGTRLREAAASEGLRAALAWAALANPRWHQGRSAAKGIPRPAVGELRGCAR